MEFLGLHAAGTKFVPLLFSPSSNGMTIVEIMIEKQFGIEKEDHPLENAS